MRQARLKMWDLIYSVCEKELLQTLDNGTKSNSLYLQGHLERKVHEGVPGTESPLLLLLSQIICCLRVSPCFLAPLVCCFLLDFAFFSPLDIRLILRTSLQQPNKMPSAEFCLLSVCHTPHSLHHLQFCTLISLKRQME